MIFLLILQIDININIVTSTKYANYDDGARCNRLVCRFSTFTPANMCDDFCVVPLAAARGVVVRKSRTYALMRLKQQRFQWYYSQKISLICMAFLLFSQRPQEELGRNNHTFCKGVGTPVYHTVARSIHGSAPTRVIIVQRRSIEQDRTDLNQLSGQKDVV